jgi:hypothetical protein
MPTLQEVQAKTTVSPGAITGWTDFKRQLDAVPKNHGGSDTDAYCIADLTYIGAAVSKNLDGLYRFSGTPIVKVALNQTISFVLKSTINGAQSTAILIHEKGHYNLTIIAARQLCSALMMLENADSSQLKKDADQLLADTLTTGQAVQDQYEETANDANKQAIWDGKIQTALSDLSVKLNSFLP